MKNKNLGSVRGLSFADVAMVAVAWIGAGVVTYFAKDAFVGLIGISASYYLAKWIVLKKENAD